MKNKKVRINFSGIATAEVSFDDNGKEQEVIEIIDIESIDNFDVR